MNPEKLKKLQAQVRIGGKGTARRKKKIVHKTAAFAERKLQNAIQKISEVDLTEIDEVNIMKDDGEVIHFKNPSVQASRSANMVAISGQAEHKHVSEMLPNIIPQLGMDGLRYGANYALGIGDKNDLAIEPCNQVLSCGHLCSGIKDEKKCPPCLQPECCVNESSQTGNDYCMICLTELSEFPIIQLKCGHVYHFECAKDVLKKRWPDTRMSFHFSLCPICMEPIEHRELMTLLEPINALQNEVMKKSLLMLQNEGLENSDTITDPNSFYYNNPEQYAMDRYSFYQCNVCKKPYFGGVAQCEGGAVAEVKVEELVCPPCSGPQIAQPCNIHGTDFLYFKCKYCCSVAVYFCFGNTHFCDACHTDYRNLLWMDAFNMLPQCPAGPSGKQLSGKCPLGVQHSPNGKECCLGCELCRINTV